MVQMVGVPMHRLANCHARELSSAGNDHPVALLACKTDNADRLMGMNSVFEENSSRRRCFESVEVRQGQ
jgi:hypothetical protein